MRTHKRVRLDLSFQVCNFKHVATHVQIKLVVTPTNDIAYNVFGIVAVFLTKQLPNCRSRWWLYGRRPPQAVLRVAMRLKPIPPTIFPSTCCSMSVRRVTRSKWPCDRGPSFSECHHPCFSPILVDYWLTTGRRRRGVQGSSSRRPHQRRHGHGRSCGAKGCRSGATGSLGWQRRRRPKLPTMDVTCKRCT